MKQILRPLPRGGRISKSTLLFFLVLLVSGLCPAWIELLFHLTPDSGHGELERIAVALIAAITIFRARSRRRRLSASRSHL